MYNSGFKVFLFIVSLFISNTAYTQSYSNLEFIRDALEKSSQRILALDALQRGSALLVLSCQSRLSSEYQDAPIFARDVFVKAALDNKRQILLKTSDADSATYTKNALNVDLIFEKWDFTASKNSGKVVQELAVDIRYLLSDKNGGIVKTGVDSIRAERVLPEGKALARAEHNQPDFAQTVKFFSRSKRDILGTLFIAAATTTTAFLLFRLRSQ